MIPLVHIDGSMHFISVKSTVGNSQGPRVTPNLKGDKMKLILVKCANICER